jgi:regulatory protein
MRKSRNASRSHSCTAWDRGLGLLARREYSRRELRARLERAGHDEAETTEALSGLRRGGYQSDRRFGEMILRARVAQGYGPSRIRAELRSHGLGDPLIRELIGASGTDWRASAAAQLRKRYGREPATDHAGRGKRAAFLLRRGFPAATVRSVTHAEVDDPSD